MRARPRPVPPRLAWLTVVALGACSAGGDGAGLAAPDYPNATLAIRAGEALAPVAPTGVPSGATFSVAPSLPDGLTLDPTTGAITGTPVDATAPREHVVSMQVDGARADVAITIAVGAALPTSLASLEATWQAEVVVDGAAQPVRVAPATDGRVFVAERQTGAIRVIGTDGQLRSTPFTTLAVLNDGHRGLLGLVAAPRSDGGTDLFAAVCSPAEPGHADRLRVLRFDAAGDVATGAPTVILDDVDLAAINVGGELAVDADGRLIVALGDREDPALAADPASQHGKILRVDRDGAPSTDNPRPSDPVFALGLRNVFALAVHPGTGGLFAADNGPDSDDRLIYVQTDRDFGWGAVTPPSGSREGYVIRRWVDVVVPTALAWVTPDELWMTSYTAESIVRFRMSGDAAVDLDQEDTFAAFVPSGIANKPLCVRRAPDGAVWVSTFSQVLRLTPIAP